MARSFTLPTATGLGQSMRTEPLAFSKLTRKSMIRVAQRSVFSDWHKIRIGKEYVWLCDSSPILRVILLVFAQERIKSGDVILALWQVLSDCRSTLKHSELPFDDLGGENVPLHT